MTIFREGKLGLKADLFTDSNTVFGSTSTKMGNWNTGVTTFEERRIGMVSTTMKMVTSVKPRAGTTAWSMAPSSVTSGEELLWMVPGIRANSTGPY